MTQEIDVFKDSQAAKVSGDQLAHIGALALEVRQHEQQIAALELKVDEHKKAVRRLLVNDIPDAMQEAKVTSYVTEDGSKVELKQVVSAGIPKDRQDEAFAWLEANGHGDLIKNLLTVEFGRGAITEARRWAAKLAEHGLSTATKQSVHGQTLAAWCREQLAHGANLPAELLGIYHAYQAKLTAPKAPR